MPDNPPSYPYGDLPKGWESDVLSSINAPVTQGNVHFLDAWEVLEHGHKGVGATYNPFNTTVKEPGSTDLSGNPAHVQNFPDWQTGLLATKSTLNQFNFADIEEQIQAGHIQTDSVVSSPDFAAWSGYNPVTNQGYTQIDTRGLVEQPSKSYSYAPAPVDTGGNPTPSPSPSPLSISPWLIVAIVLVAIFVVLK